MALFSAQKPVKKASAHIFRALAIFTVIAALVLAAPLETHAAKSKSKGSGGNPRYAALVMDADTGQILFERSADKTLHPASLVKIMTLLMTFEAIEQGRITPHERIRISQHAASMVPSKIGLSAGSTIRVEDAIRAVVTKSANDIAAALGEKIGGSESNFALMMTRKAREIGMTGTRFKNASGLHHKEQVTTARDMARLARYMIHNYGGYYHYFSTRNFTYQGKSYHNHNRLMETYKGMDGIKTGFIGPSGFNLVASAKRDGRRLIGVVFGGQTAASRNAHMKKLLDDAFARTGSALVAQAAIPIPARKPVAGLQLAAVSPASGGDPASISARRTINPSLQGSAFQEHIGQGDYDPAERQRLETGLMAIAAVREDSNQQRSSAQLTPPAPRRTGAWSIQVGAFESRVRTDLSIRTAQQSLPADLSGAAPVIVPLKTREGWVFRGRLSGYTRDEALRACTLLKECLPVSPAAH